jgi:hypothetical protein
MTEQDHLDKVVIFEGPERWKCTDSRWPLLNGQITSNKGTIAAWRQAEIAFEVLYIADEGIVR